MDVPMQTQPILEVFANEGAGVEVDKYQVEGVGVVVALSVWSTLQMSDDERLVTLYLSEEQASEVVENVRRRATRAA